jgi:hypothetical protein
MLPREDGHRTGRTQWSEAEGIRSSDRMNEAERSRGKTVSDRPNEAERSRGKTANRSSCRHGAPSRARGLRARRTKRSTAEQGRSRPLSRSGAARSEFGLRVERTKRSTVAGGRSSATLTKWSNVEGNRPSGWWNEARHRGRRMVIGHSHEVEQRGGKPAFGLVERSEAPRKEDGHRPLSRSRATSREAGLRVGRTR